MPESAQRRRQVIPRFMSLMDAVIWVSERDRKCIGNDCDLGAPCKRHDRTYSLGLRLWKRQLVKGKA